MSVDELLTAGRTGIRRRCPRETVEGARLARATDMVGGVEAWLAAGLPVTGAPVDVRE